MDNFEAQISEDNFNTYYYYFIDSLTRTVAIFSANADVQLQEFYQILLHMSCVQLDILHTLTGILPMKNYGNFSVLTW